MFSKGTQLIRVQNIHKISSNAEHSQDIQQGKTDDKHRAAWSFVRKKLQVQPLVLLQFPSMFPFFLFW
jgi:hypothetical protein